MGFKFALLKENNFINADFLDAYWKLDNVSLITQNGTFGVYYDLKAYPSRYSSKIEGITTARLPFGGSTRYNYEPELYQFSDFVPIEIIFPKGNIPTNMDEIKSIVYKYVKEKLQLDSAIDVYEPGQALAN